MKMLEKSDKVLAFIKLNGVRFQDKIHIHKAKLIYLLYRVCRLILPLRWLHIGRFLSKDVLARIWYGKFYCRKYDEDLGIISDAYEVKTIREFIKMTTGKNLVVDVGAHIGKYTVLAAKLSKNVLALEPNKENFKILKRNIKINGLKNVRVLRLAASNKNSKFKLYIGDSSGHHSISRKFKDYQIVSGVKLDSLFKKLKVDKVDLVKIDVEGAEMQVLLGMKEYLRKKKIKNIIIEISSKNVGKVKRFFEELGYSIKPLEGENFLVRC